MHTFSPKSVRMTGGSLPSSSFSRMNPQRMKKFSFLPRTPKREGIFTAYFTGLIYSRVPTLHKLCVTIRTHELQARATVLMQATRNCFLLPTPKHDWIYSNPFTGILSSCVRTIFATFLPNSQTSISATCFLQARATMRLQTLRDWFFYLLLLNAKEFIQILLRASYTHAAEQYATKNNFVVRPAARGKVIRESDHSNASNAAMHFFVTSVSSIHTGERPYACKQRGNAFF